MKRLILMVCATALLGACAAGSAGGGTTSGNANARLERAVRTRADYWQRADSVSAQYMIGPKAQHELNKDIASCVSQVRELVRLGSIREAKPPVGIGMDPGMQKGWDSVTRDGPLYKEYTDFQDFDGCMKANGWERVDFVRPVTADSAAANYVTTIMGRPFGWSSSNNTYSSPSQENNGSFNK